MHRYTDAMVLVVRARSSCPGDAGRDRVLASIHGEPWPIAIKPGFREPHGSRTPRVSPGAGWGAVAVEYFGLVRVPRGGGTVGVEHDGPAHLVDDHVMVVPTEQGAVFDAGLAAVGLVGQMVHLTRRGGLVAAAQQVVIHSNSSRTFSWVIPMT